MNLTRELANYVDKSIKILPRSKAKGTAVLRRVGQLLNISSLMEPGKSRNPPTNDRVKQVTAFYQHDEVSRQLPGKNDFKIIRVKGGKRKIQKREMLMSIEDIQEISKRFPRNSNFMLTFC